MKEFNIIGDIAGQYGALERLLAKMPEGAVPVSVGDMVDRGPDSNKVVEFFMKNGLAVRGNHEDMMADRHRGGKECVYNMRFRWEVWLGNGGDATLKSYEDMEEAEFTKHLEWLERLPLFIEEDGLIITHAPINPVLGFEKLKTVPPIEDYSLCWNRGRPREIEGKVQVFGHEASRNVQYYGPKEKLWALGIDTSRAGVLTGIHWPSMEIFQEEI